MHSLKQPEQVPDHFEDTIQWDHVDVAALLETNIIKMHHQQHVSQWIRALSFAMAGLVGGDFWRIESPAGLVFAFTAIELTFFIILMWDIGWHRSMWRYRENARLCETYLMGRLSAEQLRNEYTLPKRQPDDSDLNRRTVLLDNLKSIWKTDFVEIYLIVTALIVFVARLTSIL